LSFIEFEGSRRANKQKEVLSLSSVVSTTIIPNTLGGPVYLYCQSATPMKGQDGGLEGGE